MNEHDTPIDPQQLDVLRHQHFGRLLLRTYRAFSVRALEKLHVRGHHGLAFAHTMVLANVDRQGTRLTTLAERVGVTRQAISHLLHELEQQGYVKRAPDPTDRRAVIVTLTEGGWGLLQDVVEAKMEIEREYSTILGTTQMHMLREGLMTLLHYLEKDDPEANNSRMA